MRVCSLYIVNMMTFSIFCRLLALLLLASQCLPDPVPDSPTLGQLKVASPVTPKGEAGTLMVYTSQGWGFVCDDGWTLPAAHVACRSMGFPRALVAATSDQFGFAENSESRIVLDDVQCFGDEESLLDCSHLPVGVHDCHRREAAGVFCAPKQAGVEPPEEVANPPSPATTTTTTTTTTTRRSGLAAARLSAAGVIGDDDVIDARGDVGDDVDNDADVMTSRERSHHRRLHKVKAYKVRVVDGRNPNEGRVEVKIGGRWGVICADTWGVREAMVVCRQTGRSYARSALQINHFGGEDQRKLAAGIRCDGQEEKLSNCAHEQAGRHVVCPRQNLVAGVICTQVLPDLVPNATLLQQTTYLEDRPMLYMQCALEENCASSSAYDVLETDINWSHHRRRLLRFSSSTWNFGTADFRPYAPKSTWEWHLCHAHYHSMAIFAHYDLLDQRGNRVADGHKASFCLEDVQCQPGREKKYACQDFNDQGISVGCADDYLHDIDCQWIDVTGVPPGNYTFLVHVNPEYIVPELDFRNNLVTCNLEYNGGDVRVRNCTHVLP